MRTDDDIDRLPGLHPWWTIAHVIVASAFLGGVPLAIVGLIPFNLGFAVTLLSAPVAFLLTATERRRAILELDQLLCRPGWAGAGHGASQAQPLAIFRGEGRLRRGSRRASTMVIGFDESVFVALTHRSGGRDFRRRVLRKDQTLAFDVRVVQGHCLLEERRSGLRLRLVPDRGALVSAASYFGLDGGDPEGANGLTSALRSAGWC